MKTAVVLLSGGLDSSTVLAQALADGYTPIALSIFYGQKHQRELEAAKAIVAHFHIQEHYILAIDLSQWGGSALTSPDIPVPTTGVNPAIIPPTYVPGRNTVFIAVALSLAEAKGAEAVYLGINAVDYSGYPDCRPEYLQAFQHLVSLSCKVGIAGNPPRLVAPLIHDRKVDIVKKALALGVPIELTWSCYQGGEKPCGVCDACRIRQQALIEAGRPDLV
ncbi:MAG: 7-cyano-7-deazaguanine synthase QueC [Pseudanabaenaceae cyanobacterium SKYGB_i_bin29]|nr:7-cyano-7-deazaguanine synthase QueC [Pseudanabaenaceae cyanobacterium SKYG29]MDW8420660.1 7-cyano-7-deazaguanine synthase QueC [Pseudanabaenaceae cyanobacterium SKYGB_i_bin29]